MRYKSPLRYPGGKSVLAEYIAAIFDANDLNDGHYAEPYAGGAGVALALLYTDRASHIHINDLDRSIYAFWWAALNETEKLCRLVRDTPASVGEWQRQRLVQDRKERASLLKLGFSTFYLNRTSRSGIIATGGVIGGLDQTGAYGVGARYTQLELIKRIERVAEYRDRISLTQFDAELFLGLMVAELPKKSLVYLDPPYFVKGQRLYANFYGPQDHQSIAQCLTDAPWPWLVSYDAAPEILKIYRAYSRVLYDLKYSAAARSVGHEVIYFSPGLVKPGRAPVVHNRRSIRAS